MERPASSNLGETDFIPPSPPPRPLRRDRFDGGIRQRLGEGAPYLVTVRKEWNDSLRRAVPGPAWLDRIDEG
jgi:hypothetical protein